MRYFTMTIVLLIIMSACGSEYPFEGKVIDIEKGKDGYTAILLGNTNDTMSAVISRVNMGEAYLTVENGQQVQVDGDTFHLGNRLHIKASKIKIK